jgi:hypothetical protein
VTFRESERFVISFNPEAAERDQAIRERLVAQLYELIDDTDTWPVTKRAELRGPLPKLSEPRRNNN